MKRPHLPSVRQLAIGLLALPLSLLPFAAYLSWTPEGRLVRDRVLVAVNPPTLPRLTDAEIRRGVIPEYTGAVMLLAYHGIGSASDGEGGFVVSPDRFGEHLAALKRAGMTTVTAQQVADSFAGGKPLPPRAVMLTFDDGRNDAFMFADPLLEQAGMSATMFVITGAASDPGLYYADWDRLEEAAESGRWDLQSHSHAMHREQSVGEKSFPALTSTRSKETLRDYTRRVRADFERANDALEKHSGDAPVAFAYPFGAYGADRTNDDRIRDALRAEVAQTYALGFHQDEQDSVALATPYDDRTGLRRLEVGDWSAKELMRRIATAASRTEAAIAARQSALNAEISTGAELPPGVVTEGVDAVAAPARTSRRSPPTPTPQPAPAAPPAEVVISQPQQPSTPSSPPGSTGSPWSPPATSPPRTTPTNDPPSSDPTPTDEAPGGSDDKPGNGNGRDNGNGRGNGKDK